MHSTASYKILFLNCIGFVFQDGGSTLTITAWNVSQQKVKISISGWVHVMHYITSYTEHVFHVYIHMYYTPDKSKYPLTSIKILHVYVKLHRFTL